MSIFYSFWLSGDVQRDIDMLTQDFRLSYGKIYIDVRIGSLFVKLVHRKLCRLSWQVANFNKCSFIQIKTDCPYSITYFLSTKHSVLRIMVLLFVFAVLLEITRRIKYSLIYLSLHCLNLKTLCKNQPKNSRIRIYFKLCTMTLRPLSYNNLVLVNLQF